MEAWEKAAPEISPYDGIADLLHHLAEKEIPMAIVSSRESRLIWETLEKLSWKGYFSAVVGQEDAPRHKPAPQPFLMAARAMELDPEHCIYVGDQPWDIQALKSAGMYSGAALWGEGRLEELEVESPNFLFHLPSDAIKTVTG